jgi:phosphoribosyl 1,2-cyclic phosphodiesterase
VLGGWNDLPRPEVRLATLGSGSRGNSVLVECDGTRILVDAGFSGAELARRLDRLEVSPDSIEAVVVTHEHRDHTSGLGVAARRWGWPLHLTGRTAAACAELFRGGETIRHCEGEVAFSIGAAEIHPFSTCHDAADPIALTVTDSSSGLRAGIATDLGRATAPVRAALMGCHFLVLEANHDEAMLRESPYPWSVKQRIGGSRGHLSNRLAADLVAELSHADLGGILLAHLSDECNDPTRAHEVARRSLGKSDYRGILAVAMQDEPSRLFDVARLVRRARDGGPQLSLFARA